MPKSITCCSYKHDHMARYDLTFSTFGNPVGAAGPTGSSTDASHCSLDETVSCPSVRKLSFPNICSRAM